MDRVAHWLGDQDDKYILSFTLQDYTLAFVYNVYRVFRVFRIYRVYRVQ